MNSVFKVFIRIYLKAFVEFFKFVIIKDFLRISNVIFDCSKFFMSSLLRLWIHPGYVVQDEGELVLDVPDHLLHGLLGVLVEVLQDVHLADGGREAARSGAHATLPSRRRLLFAGDIFGKLFRNFPSILVQEPDGGPGHPPHHVVGDVALGLVLQKDGQVFQIFGGANDNSLGSVDLKKSKQLISLVDCTKKIDG